MKALFILIFSFLSLHSLFGQISEGTTEEEFLYSTKGYTEQISKGLDAEKNGYLIKDLFTHEGNVDFIGLFDEETNDLRSIIMHVRPLKRYFCVPNFQTAGDVKDKCDKQFQAIGWTYSSMIMRAQNALIAKLISERNK